MAESETILINSSSRASGSIASGTYILPPNLIRCDPNESITVKLEYFQAPHSWYNVSSTRNGNIVLVEDETQTAITLTDGNYDAKQLASHIGTALTANSHAGGTFVSTWSPITGKISITLTGSSSSITAITFVGSESMYLFGFTSATESFQDGLLTSDQMISIGNVKALVIHSDIAKRLYMTTSGATNQSNVFAIVPNLAPALGEVIYESANGLEFSVELSSVTGIGSVLFEIRDTRGNLVEMSDNWIIGLSITKQLNLHTRSTMRIFEMIQKMGIK
jgi:hypothetical protein